MTAAAPTHDRGGLRPETAAHRNNGAFALPTCVAACWNVCLFLQQGLLLMAQQLPGPESVPYRKGRGFSAQQHAG